MIYSAIPPKHRLRAHLKRGGVIAYPTESCYGLGGLPQHPRAIRQILRLKKRPQNKGLITIGDTLSRLQPLLCRLPESQQRALNHIWPAPKTFVLPAKKTVLPQLRGKGRTKIAVRIPDHRLARQLCHIAQSPLISTSCNRAKAKPCKTVHEVRRQFGRHILIIRGRIGSRKQPSEIIDWEQNQQIR